MIPKTLMMRLIPILPQFQMSGTSQISILKNGSFYNADTGIDVDVPIASTETMYDCEKLVEFIHQLK